VKTLIVLATVLALSRIAMAAEGYQWETTFIRLFDMLD
jgi:hypothetical protein